MSEADATVIEDDNRRRYAQEVIQVPAPASRRSRLRALEGLAWSHELDLAQLLAAVGAAQLGGPGDEDAAAEEAAAADVSGSRCGDAAAGSDRGRG